MLILPSIIDITSSPFKAEQIYFYHFYNNHKISFRLRQHMYDLQDVEEV